MSLNCKTPDDVLALIKEKEVKFVDLRFTDPRGKWQHLAVTIDIASVFELDFCRNVNTLAYLAGDDRDEAVLVEGFGLVIPEQFVIDVTADRRTTPVHV